MLIEIVNFLPNISKQNPLKGDIKAADKNAKNMIFPLILAKSSVLYMSNLLFKRKFSV
jgi:hypothetical protein